MSCRCNTLKSKQKLTTETLLYIALVEKGKIKKTKQRDEPDFFVNVLSRC